MHLIFLPSSSLKIEKAVEGDKPPSGFVSISDSNRDGYEKREKDGKVQWFPGKEGEPSSSIDFRKDVNAGNPNPQESGGSQPPPGFSPTPNSKIGSYRKKDGDHYVYWRPGEGITSKSPDEEHEKQGRGEEEQSERSQGSWEPTDATKAIEDITGEQGQQEMAQVMRQVQGDPNDPEYQGKVAQEVLARNSALQQEWRNNKLALFSILAAVSKTGQGAAWLAGGGRSNPVSERFKAWSEKSLEGLSPEEKVVGASYAADWSWWGLPLAAAKATGVAALKYASYGTVFKSLVSGVVGVVGLGAATIPVLGIGVAGAAAYVWYAGVGGKFYNNIVKRAAHAIGQKIYNGELDVDMLEKMHGTQYGEEYTEEQTEKMYTKALFFILTDMYKAEGFDLLKAVQEDAEPIENDPQMQQMLAGLIAELHTGAYQDTLAELDQGALEISEHEKGYMEVIVQQMMDAGLMGEGAAEMSEEGWEMFFQRISTHPFANWNESTPGKKKEKEQSENASESASNFKEEGPQEKETDSHTNWPNSQEPQPFTRSLSYSPFYTPSS